MLNKKSGVDSKLIQKAYAKYETMKKNKKKSEKGYYPSDKIADKQFDATTRDKGY